MNGSAAQTSGGTLDHPAMIASLDVLGSMVLDVSGDRLEGRFLDAAGAVRDSFGDPQAGARVPLGRWRPRDSRSLPRGPRRSRTTDVSWTLPRAGHGGGRVYDVSGRRVRTLTEGTHAAGSRTPSAGTVATPSARASRRAPT